MAITVHGVTKRFGDWLALDDVSIDVPDGALTALLVLVLFQVIASLGRSRAAELAAKAR